MKLEVGTKLVSQGSMRTYELQAKLGSGGHGEVFKAVDLKSRKLVAIKIIISHSKDHAQYILKEVEMLRLAGECCRERAPEFYEAFQLRSGNVFRGHSVHTCVVMQFIDGCTLAHMIMKRCIFHEVAASYIILEIAKAVASLHSRSLVHRDIKSENIMIDRAGNVYVCDFGVSRALTENNGLIGTIGGTPFFMAPEILRGEEYNEKVDIYSLGIVCIDLVTGSYPKPARLEGTEPPQNSLSQARRVTAEDVTRGLDPRVLSSNFRDIIRKCLHFDPNERCNASNLVSALESHLNMVTSHLCSSSGKFDPQRGLSALIHQGF